mmetsp:Transcript_5042/g.18370  ORF Transcript_5042/g.18370 Transcript_5042/m.18370 type:complete len:442 (+) Transcript_5042:111-1436(+)
MAAQAKPPGDYRPTVLLGAMSVFISYTDRINISIAVPAMVEEFNWDNSRSGVVLGAFFWGYILTQVAGGVLSQRFGGKYVLVAAVLMWSAMTLLTPMAARVGHANGGSITLLVLVRILTGVGEGAGFPAMMSVFGRVVPKAHYSRSIGLSQLMVNLGTVVALYVSPHLIKQAGWPSVFYAFGLLGFLWAPLWLWFALPGSGVDTVENEEGSHGSEASRRPIPWPQIWSSRAFLAIVGLHFGNNWLGFALGTWFPTYLHAGLQVSMEDLGLTMVPYVAKGAMSLAALRWGDQLVYMIFRTGATGTGPNASKRVRQTAVLPSSIIIASLIALIPFLDSVTLCILCVAISFCFQSLVECCGFNVNILEVAPTFAGPVFGVSNSIACIPGMLGVPLNGRLLDILGDGQNGASYAGWRAVFWLAAGIYFGAGASYTWNCEATVQIS